MQFEVPNANQVRQRAELLPSLTLSFLGAQVENNFQVHHMYNALHPLLDDAERLVVSRSFESIRVIHYSGDAGVKPWTRCLQKTHGWPSRDQDEQHPGRHWESRCHEKARSGFRPQQRNMYKVDYLKSAASHALEFCFLLKSVVLVCSVYSSFIGAREAENTHCVPPAFSLISRSAGFDLLPELCLRKMRSNFILVYVVSMRQDALEFDAQLAEWMLAHTNLSHVQVGL